MPQLLHDNSGYFDIDSDHDNQDNQDNISLLCGHGIGPMQPPSLRRMGSSGSICSSKSRGSSQYWEEVSTPDDDTLLAVDKTVSQHQLLQDVQNDGMSDSWATHSNVKEPSRVCMPCTGNVNKTFSHGKRQLSQIDGPHASQSRRQRPKLEIGLNDGDNLIFIHPSLESTSPEHSEADFQSISSPTLQTVTVVAHSDRHQRYFDKHKLPWGVQWEIARLVSCQKIEYNGISLNVLNQLSGKSNLAGAPLVEELLCGQEGGAQRRQLYNEAFAKELSTKTPWSELDKEEEHLSRDALSGLGGTSLQDDWFGGKVSFVATLRQKEQPKKRSGYKTKHQYFLELEPPELGPSTRITRRWGSHRFLRVRIPRAVMYQPNNDLTEYFSRPIVIHAKVFRPFYAKDSGVFLLEVDEAYWGNCLRPELNPAKISLDRFFEWHNPMQFNQTQESCGTNISSLAKWCTRMALGLSNSVPGIEFAEEDIMEIDDIYTPAGQAAIAVGQKPDAQDVTTDGCGFINQKALVDAKYRYNWDLVPSAMQFRIGGSKGLLLRHPDEHGSIDGPPRMWVRPSQIKISYAPGVPRDRAHVVLDILRRSRLKYPARLSTQIIVNLAENGVSYDVFEHLMLDGLGAIAASLTQWSGPYAMQNLWAAIARQGSVIRSRMSREAAGSSRVYGFSMRDKEEEEDEDEEAIDIPVGSKAWWADEISGCPSSLEETVLILLDAGFEPQSCHILAAKLKEVFKKALNTYIEDYRIEVPRSAEAWVVPDPCGVLEPGEIFLRTSEQIIGHDGLKTDHLLGDVLVTRHPCCVPSDIQKVHSVWKDELRGYYDVIIFSVKGDRSLASMLGGGDYDGDTVHVIWDPDVVAAFTNANDKFADPPPGLDDAFEKNTMTVEDFLENDHESHEAMILERQGYLLAALKNVSLIGSYSNWHDTAVYKHGYDSDEAWRLAYMFCTVLDSSKTGKTVRPEILSKDRSTYNGPGPEWKASLLDENNHSGPPPDHGIAPRRQGQLTSITFIMDQLKYTARKQYNYHMMCFEKLLEESRRKFKAQHFIKYSHLYVDPVLEAPWNNAMERAENLIKTYNQSRMKEELDAISRHVDTVCESHREMVRQDARSKQQNGRFSTSPRKDGHAFTDKPIEQRQNILRKLSLDFSSKVVVKGVEFMTLSPEDVRRYKASYAYILSTRKHEKRNSGFSRFPFDVAMRELGIIKAASIGPCNMVSSRFYSVFNVTGAIKSFRPADGPAYTC